MHLPRRFCLPVLAPALLAAMLGLGLASCADDGPVVDPNGPQLIFRFVFDSSQARLNNLGQPSTLPAGHAAQSPRFRHLAAHYIELLPTALTQVGTGPVLYLSPSTTQGGDTAIDFRALTLAQNGDTFFRMPLSQVPSGTYPYLRVSLAYQAYEVTWRADTFGQTYRSPATIYSFVGYNQYLDTLDLDGQPQPVNGNRRQGFYAWRSTLPVVNQTLADTGSAPTTTVPNPLAGSNDVPPGSCIVTGQFAQPLRITGVETEDVIVTVSVSTNRSFEWEDLNGNGEWDIDKGESPVDMGLRGMVPQVGP